MIYRNTKRFYIKRPAVFAAGISALVVFSYSLVSVANPPRAASTPDDQQLQTITTAGLSLPTDETSGDQKSGSTVQADPGINSSSGLPTTILIPSIGISSRVIEVGRDYSGKVAAPQSLHQVGWYNDSSSLNTPGGSSLFVGHSAEGQDAVFNELGSLAIGETIEIQTDSGTRTFTVVEKIKQPADQLNMTSAMVSADFSKFGVNIITCSGEYIESDNRFTERTMIKSIEL